MLGLTTNIAQLCGRSDTFFIHLRYLIEWESKVYFRSTIIQTAIHQTISHWDNPAKHHTILKNYEINE